MVKLTDYVSEDLFWKLVDWLEQNGLAEVHVDTGDSRGDNQGTYITTVPGLSLDFSKMVGCVGPEEERETVFVPMPED